MPVKEVKPVQPPDVFDPTNDGSQPPAPVQEELPLGDLEKKEEFRDALTQTELYCEYGVTITANYESVRYCEGMRYRVNEGSTLEERSEEYKTQLRKLVNRVNSIAEGRAKALFGNGK